MAQERVRIMQQGKFSLTESQVEFLDQFRTLGYSDKSSLVREAIEAFKRKLAQQQLTESASLYAETYAEENELQELTEQALEDWPE